ncbi:hypothetical protein [Candidatus Aquiluna sp. UB-MaderosW2red]|uniref:hypothetical protein n=1 Tax=Candidatus Aquiluna sp. UB-MaderosW2red TaxID=1855377 RepID=UPI000875B9D4|nr:hypothetical protein [Candidatus Aquiluna sp. UB-MaderosW2red]SCX13809.1 hypothetical protein SAMN05216534_1432 [Candidatus Aquiluna sp. UB-MaderosW2red]
MNDKFDELRIRIQAADPAQNTPELNHTVVVKASLSKTAKRFFGFKSIRLGLGGASAVAVTALALTLSANLATQPLIQLAAGAPQVASSEANTSKVMAGSDASIGIWPGYWIENEYAAGPDVSSDTGRGNVYQLLPKGSPEERLAEIAALFGIAGEIREDEWSTKEYPSFSLGTDNNQVGISWVGTGSWWYSNWSQQEPRCADGSDNFDTCEYVAIEPTPELIPSNAEVIAKALEIFGATGLEVSASEIRTYRDEWSAGATASLKVEGQETALEWSISYDSTGKLAYAYGQSVEIVERGDFKTISPLDAVDRISDGRWFGSPSSNAWNLYYDAEGMNRIQEALPAESELKVTGDSSPTESQPEVRIVKLTIEKSTAAMLMIYDKNGGVWLVPGYLLHNNQGWFDAVISLEEGVIELYDPVEFSPENLKIEVDPAQG